MKKRAASIALVLSMILSFTCQAGAVDANSGDDGQQVSTYAALEASAQSGGLTKLNAVKYILLDCGMKGKRSSRAATATTSLWRRA